MYNLKKAINKKILKVIGAHNSLTAKIGEEAGFDAIWLSSFEVSASYAVSDSSFITSKEMREIALSIINVINIPLIIDADTGYGDYKNVYYAFRQFKQIGAKGVCLEDKIFPKNNSFSNDTGQKLIDTDEFVEKIKYAKKAFNSKDSVVIARTEALILGKGLKEAYIRSKAYVKAGADMILIHSKKNDSKEIIDFAKSWDLDIPLVIVPTTYYKLDYKTILKTKNIKMIIYANHGVRTIIKSLRDNFKEIIDKKSTKTIEKKIATVNDIFDLQQIK